MAKDSKPMLPSWGIQAAAQAKIVPATLANVFPDLVKSPDLVPKSDLVPSPEGTFSGQLMFILGQMHLFKRSFLIGLPHSTCPPKIIGMSVKSARPFGCQRLTLCFSLFHCFARTHTTPFSLCRARAFSCCICVSQKLSALSWKNCQICLQRQK